MHSHKQIQTHINTHSFTHTHTHTHTHTRIHTHTRTNTHNTHTYETPLADRLACAVRNINTLSMCSANERGQVDQGELEKLININYY